MPGVTGAKKVQISRNTTSYIKSDGTLWAAGWHNYIEGALYNYDTKFVQMPIGTVKDYSAGGDYIMVNRGTVGKIEGWGGNGNGKLGDDSILEKHQLSNAFFTPVVQPAPTPVVQPAPAPVVQPAPAPTDKQCSVSVSPFQKIDLTQAIRCSIPVYTSMNACLADIRRNYSWITQPGQVCKNLIIPADRGQQEKAPAKK